MNPQDITPAKAKEIRLKAGFNRPQLASRWGIHESGIKGKEQEYNGHELTGKDRDAYWALWKLFGRKK